MSTFLAFRTIASTLRPQPSARIYRSSLFPLPQKALGRNLSNFQRSHPKNGQIPYEIVQVKDEDGTLHHAQKLSKVLESVDTATHVVRLVSHDPPLVRIFTQLEDKMNKVATKAKKKAREEKRHLTQKEAQLSWFTAQGDFDHKVNKIQEELEKGDMRVNIVFMPKPKVRNPTGQEMTEQVEAVRKKLEVVSEEWRPRLYERGSVTMYLQSIVKKTKKTLPTQDEVEELAKEGLERMQRQLERKRKKEESKRELEKMQMEEAIRREEEREREEKKEREEKREREEEREREEKRDIEREGKRGREEKKIKKKQKQSSSTFKFL